MPQQTKIFRVFVSSTFNDMKEERRILQTIVFPRLESFCDNNGGKFQAVDLRWGINEELQKDQKTIDICLNEIARCQRISPKPNFIVLLGDRYGWQPLPAKIPENEIKLIVKQCTKSEKELLNKWYWLDENAIPPEYILQPYNNLTIGQWGEIESNLKAILRAAVNKLNFSSHQCAKYFTSATHQEIVLGALNPPHFVNNATEHVFAYARTIAGLPDNKSDEGFIDLNGNVADQFSVRQMRQLKNELRTQLGGTSWE